MKIETKENGFILNSIEYTFEGKNKIISNSQALIETSIGVVLLDLSCTINDVEFTNINSFVSALGVTEIVQEPTQEELIAQKEAELLTMYKELEALKGQ
jgi:hypothetical protein